MLGAVTVAPHGDNAHLEEYVHAGGSITESITGLKTFEDVATFAAGAADAPGVVVGEAGLGVYQVGAGELGLAATAGVTIADGAAGAYARIVKGATGGALALGLNDTLDAYLAREAAGYLLQRNGANAQRFGVAGTYTADDDYEIGEIGWSGTTLRVGTSHAGDGEARPLALMTGGADRWTVDATAGHLTAVAGTQQIRWGATASFPMLKRSSTAIQIMLADESANAPLTVGSFTMTGALFALSTVGPHAIGASPLSSTFLRVSPSNLFTGTRSVSLDGTVTATLSVSPSILDVTATIITHTSGTHARGAAGYFKLNALQSVDGVISEGASLWVAAPTGDAAAITTPYALMVESGSVRIAGAGPHAIGQVLSTSNQLTLGGAFTSGAAGGAALRINSTLTAADTGNRNVHGIRVSPTLVTVSGQAHTLFSALRVEPPTVTINGGATVAEASTLSISGAPTNGTVNYALHVEAGAVRIDDILLVGTPTLTNAAAGDVRANGALWLKDGMAAPTATAAFAVIYVDTADGDLKVKFADGVTKVLAADT